MPSTLGLRFCFFFVCLCRSVFVKAHFPVGCWFSFVLHCRHRSIWRDTSEVSLMPIVFQCTVQTTFHGNLSREVTGFVDFPIFCFVLFYHVTHVWLVSSQIRAHDAREANAFISGTFSKSYKRMNHLINSLLGCGNLVHGSPLDNSSVPLRTCKRNRFCKQSIVHLQVSRCLKDPEKYPTSFHECSSMKAAFLEHTTYLFLVLLLRNNEFHFLG